MTNHQWNNFIFQRVIVAAAIIGSIVMFATESDGHEAPTGWVYPYACCSDEDCREVSSASVSEGPQGYTIAGTGEVLSYADKRVRNSPDGVFHWCSVAGKSSGRTVCLFVPPRAF